MSAPDLPFSAQAFQSALEAGDFERADATLAAYIAWLQSGQRTLSDVEKALNLLQWGLRVATARRALLKVVGKYAPASPSHAWHVDA